MFLRQTTTGDLVKVLNMEQLMNFNSTAVTGQYQAGEEEQDPEDFAKAELHFLSGEDLPRCWTDPHYRDDELKR